MEMSVLTVRTKVDRVDLCVYVENEIHLERLTLAVQSRHYKTQASIYTDCTDYDIKNSY